MNPTIHDVARVARTSKSTVSRYLNGQKVKKDTEMAIEEAIRELNFHRNMNARRLVMNKTHTMAVVIDDIANPFYSGMIRGIESVAASSGYHCIFLSSTSHYNEESSYLRLVYEGQADGLILISFREREEDTLHTLAAAAQPVVLIGHAGVEAVMPSVDVDHQAGIGHVVRQLHDMNHRKLAFIAGPRPIAAGQQRLDGFRHAVNELGLELKEDWIITSDWSNPGGYHAMKQLLSDREPGFTAVIASNDEIALGAMRCLQEQGLRVPLDISLTGYDDIAVSGWIQPGLTTVRQPFLEVGRRAAQLLITSIEGQERSGPLRELVTPVLVNRESCQARL